MRTDENISNVKEMIENCQFLSVKKISAQVRIARESVGRILKVDLKLKPYKIQTCQQLTESDNERRLQFCHAVNELTATGQKDVNNVIFSDESHIYLNGFTNE